MPADDCNNIKTSQFQAARNQRIRSNPVSDHVYFAPRQAEPRHYGYQASPSDLPADAARLQEMRRSFGDTARLADDYVELALRYGSNGKEAFSQMMRYLEIALEIRKQVFEANDPMLAIIYRQMYNVSFGSIPPDVSLDYLKSSVNIWEQIISENRRPLFLTTAYMNTCYQRLARLYEVTGKKELATTTLAKLSS